MKSAITPLLLLTTLIISSACQLGEPTANTLEPPSSVVQATALPATPTLVPQLQATAMPPTAAPDAETPATDHDFDESWQVLRPGLERRHVRLLADGGEVQERLYLLRIDPAHFYFDIGYKPGSAQRLMDWQQETDALIIVNGGFFTADNLATGLVITNGQPYGTSYSGFGGMLVINDGFPSIRALRQQPYDPNEPLQAALQSFPLLIAPGGQIGYPDEDGLADRRTVIAQDSQGRILFIVAGTGTLTLHETSKYLAESDLDITVALNLDGGASSGIQMTDPAEGIAPFSLLPIVITVKPRT